MRTRFGFVSTFPPTQCGLATFAAALRGAAAAAAAAPRLRWPAVADQYRRLAGRLITTSVAA